MTIERETTKSRAAALRNHLRAETGELSQDAIDAANLRAQTDSSTSDVDELEADIAAANAELAAAH